MTAARMHPVAAPHPGTRSLLLPVLPLDEVCLMPGASVTLVLDRPASVTAVQLAARTSDRLLALARPEHDGAPRELHGVGTVAKIRTVQALSPLEQRIELDGVSRARVSLLLGTDVLIAEAVPLEEGDAGDEWGAAAEALARYLHTHADLRSFLEAQPRSADAMSWVNLACQHLPISASARQKLLEQWFGSYAAVLEDRFYGGQYHHGVVAWLLDGFTVQGFVPALLGSLVVSVVSWLGSAFVPD